VLSDPTNFGNYPGDGPLRIGGQESGLPSGESNLPSKRSKASSRQLNALNLVRDCFFGNESVKEKGMTYLPKAPGEDMENYRDRLVRSVFFNAFRQTIEGLTGMVARRDVVLGDDVPKSIKDDWENIDNAGTHGDVFAREILQDSLVTGHAAILVDFPKTGGGQTAADEMRGSSLPIRPYWVPIAKENISHGVQRSRTG
jgi:hypothetical protein